MPSFGRMIVMRWFPDAALSFLRGCPSVLRGSPDTALCRRPTSSTGRTAAYAGFVPFGISRSRTTSQARPTFSISQIM